MTCMTFTQKTVRITNTPIRINEFSKAAGHKINTQQMVVFLYTNNK